VANHLGLVESGTGTVPLPRIGRGQCGQRRRARPAGNSYRSTSLSSVARCDITPNLLAGPGAWLDSVPADRLGAAL
jgi:hypothetical protein